VKCGGTKVKLYVRLQRPIPGVDPFKQVDPEQFAEFHHRWDDVAGQLDVDRINDFYVYEGENGNRLVKWHRASKALNAVRVVLEHYRSGQSSISDEARRATIDLFEKVEAILDDADLHDVRFCFVGDY
jgi:hypothetical protein